MRPEEKNGQFDLHSTTPNSFEEAEDGLHKSLPTNENKRATLAGEPFVKKDNRNTSNQTGGQRGQRAGFKPSFEGNGFVGLCTFTHHHHVGCGADGRAIASKPDAHGKRPPIEMNICAARFHL